MTGTDPRNPRRKRGYTLVSAGLLCMAPPCFGPNPHRTRDSECQVNLKYLFTAVRTVNPERHEKSGPTPTLADFSFNPDRGNRYAYFLAPGPLEDRGKLQAVKAPGQMGVGIDTFKFTGATPLTLNDLPPDVARHVRLRNMGTSYDFVAACAGDIDNNYSDPNDVWSIASMDRVIDGTPVAAGELYRHVNDAAEHE
jgi:type IV pilus assembly protein PilA